MKHYDELDEQLKELDEHYILNETDQEQILVQLNEKMDLNNSEKKLHWKPLVATGFAIILLIVMIPLFIQNSTNEASVTVLPESFDYQSVKWELELGMTPSEILEIIGLSEPSEIIESDQGFVTYRFDQGIADGYVIEEDYVDIDGLINEKVDMQVFIRFDENDEAKYISALDKIDVGINHYHLSENPGAPEFITEQTISDQHEHIQFFHIEDYVFEVPSLSFLQQYDPHFKEQFVSMEQFNAEQYDETYDFLAWSVLKHYRAGDQILIEETIHSLEYESNEDFTYIEVGPIEDTQFWAFNGDLTDRFTVGETLRVKLDVIPFSADGLYVKFGSSVDDFPNIDDFLVD